jgi:hypothetical protein
LVESIFEIALVPSSENFLIHTGQTRHRKDSSRTLVKLLFVEGVAGAEIPQVNKLTAEQTTQHGIRQVLLVMVATALMFSPTFVARMIYRRLGADISMIAIMALALFLIGAIILLKAVKEVKE